MGSLRSVWFWLSVIALLFGIAYILVMHPMVIGVIVVSVVGVALCGASWVWGK